MNIEQLIGETTEYDKKLMVEERKSKSWLKSVSAFANGIGGCLVFGVSDDDTIVGLQDAKNDSEKISEIIKTKMDPIPKTVLEISNISEKEIIILKVFPVHLQLSFRGILDRHGDLSCIIKHRTEMDTSGDRAAIGFGPFDAVPVRQIVDQLRRQLNHKGIRLSGGITVSGVAGRNQIIFNAAGPSAFCHCHYVRQTGVGLPDRF